jgi:hypothetical protein
MPISVSGPSPSADGTLQILDYRVECTHLFSTSEA